MRRINDEEKKYLLSLKPEDITYDLGMSLFANHVEKRDGKVVEVPSKFEPTDFFLLKAGEYFNKEDVETTVGSFIFNKFIIEPRFSQYIDYVNFEITDDGLGKLESQLSQLLLVDTITTDDFADYLNRIQWLGMEFHEPLAASFTMRGLKPLDSVVKRREQLIKQNKEALDKGDIMTMSAIEKELVDMAKKEVGDDPSMDLYYSGARGSIPNNYKQLSIVKGPVFNKTIGKYQFIQNSFFEGLRKEDIAAAATNVINALGYDPVGVNNWRPVYVDGEEFQGSATNTGNLSIKHGLGITITKDTSTHAITFRANTNYTTSGKNYKVEADSSTGGLYVNVPWANTTYEIVSSTSDGLAPKVINTNTTLINNAFYLLASSNGTATPSWYKLPASAFANTWRDIKIKGTSIGSNTLNLLEGSHITLSNSNGAVTISSIWRDIKIGNSSIGNKALNIDASGDIYVAKTETDNMVTIDFGISWYNLDTGQYETI